MRIGRDAGIDIGIQGLGPASLIGHGGFGAVYRARQSSLGREVAVKILSAPVFDGMTDDRFTRECAAIGALSSHPHIVSVHDSGINKWGRPYIVMDLMERGSLSKEIAANGPLSAAVATEIGVKIASAVAAAHAAGIVHRDIKPQNILLSAYGEPKLADFGISSEQGATTSSRSLTASLEHAAPELLDGHPSTPASDVYSLASSVFTMLAGHAPFVRAEGEPVAGLIKRVLMDDVPDLRPRGVPSAICAVLERGLTKDPESRIRSADEFAIALREVEESLGKSPTPYVPPAPAEAFGLVDRFSPAAPSVTAPTRVRIRQEEVRQESRRPRFTKRSAASLGLLAAVVAGALAIAPDELLAPELERVVAEPDISVPSGPHDRARIAKTEVKERRRATKGRAKKPRRQKPVTIAAPLPDSSGSSPAATTTVASAPRTSEKPERKKRVERPEPEPDYPPAPTTWLYHVWKGSDHAATINPAAYPSDYKREVEGLVYSSFEKGTKPIEIAEGTVYIFVEEFGETEPDVSRAELYKVTKGDEVFFTTSWAKMKNYTANWDWTSGPPIGYAGQQ